MTREEAIYELERMKTWSKDLSDDEIEAIAIALKALNQEPKTGHWINDNGIYKCTACNDLCTVAGWADCIPKEEIYKTFKHCPNCGAKMIESEGEE